MSCDASTERRNADGGGSENVTPGATVTSPAGRAGGTSVQPASASPVATMAPRKRVDVIPGASNIGLRPSASTRHRRQQERQDDARQHGAAHRVHRGGLASPEHSERQYRGGH